MTGFLGPNGAGKPTTLTPETQVVIAAWAAMKLMVLEYFWEWDQVIVLPQSARMFAYRERRAPENMQIGIAAVESHARPALFPGVFTSFGRVLLMARFPSTHPARPWGYRRIRGELAGLGVTVAPSTVADP